VPRRSSLRLIAVSALLAVAVAGCSRGTGYSADNDPLAEAQYALGQHQLEEAWEFASGEGVVIAIVDTGVDLDHPDLKDRLVPGYDFVDDDDQPDDLNGHGTHVAGSAAAIGNNGIGVIGMAPEASIMPIKVLAANGSGEVQDVADGIRWAVDHGADVINLSLGGSSNLLGRIFNKVDPTNEAIAYAEDRGAVVIAAAGNDNAYLTAFNLETPVVVVNATNELGKSARFSNFGDPRAVSAAGARILSTAPTYPTTIWPDGSEGYEYLDGTSMASPHVAGIAALMVDAGIGPPSVIRDRLVQTAVNVDGDPLLGAGIVQADEATEPWLAAAGLLLLFTGLALGGTYLVRRQQRGL
jgi:subtilisin family serine protease